MKHFLVSILAMFALSAVAAPRVQNIETVYVSDSTLYITERDSEQWLLAQSCDLNIQNGDETVRIYSNARVLRVGTMYRVSVNGEESTECRVTAIEKRSANAVASVDQPLQ